MELSAPIYRLKRDAKQMARAENLPLHAALRRIATQEGFRDWSHLAAAHAKQSAAATVWARLQPGDRLLLAARPEQGKTLFASEVLLHALTLGYHGHLFSLIDSAAAVKRRLDSLETEYPMGALSIDTSDAICADHILQSLAPNHSKTIVVIDYLQLLDQRRVTPPLDDQVQTLARHAQITGIVLVFLCQIDRAFDATDTSIPKLSDLRLPNPLDLGAFSKTCFLHDGHLRLEELDLK